MKVYPSYVQMRRYQLRAVIVSGSRGKTHQAFGHSEFEQDQKPYEGDDYRIISWKATARKDQLMNNYTDEHSQQVYLSTKAG